MLHTDQFTAGKQTPEVLVDHLFRHEAGKMVATLTGFFGLKNIEVAQDVVQETMLKALQNWKLNRVPDNPRAWLYRVAKNQVIDLIRKQRVHEKIGTELSDRFGDSDRPEETRLDECFLDHEIADNQLRMMFACCHPGISASSQVALTLKTLCGFSVGEIARAFFSTEDTIQKRLFRARKAIKASETAFQIPSGYALLNRLEPVRTALYLMFNEGYSGTDSDSPIRKELCAEAMRLTRLLADHPTVKRPKTQALLALMCFHASRFDARIDANGLLVLLKDQDRSKWNLPLIQRGYYHLQEAAKNGYSSEYHLEALIACYHSMAPGFQQTDWSAILHAYDGLLVFKNTPLTKLNRAIVIGQLEGPENAIREIEATSKMDKLEGYYLYHATLGELYHQKGEDKKAHSAVSKAIELARSSKDVELLQRKLALIEACLP